MTIKIIGVRRRTEKNFTSCPALEIDPFIAIVRGKSEFLLVHIPTGVIFFSSPIVSNCLLYAFAVKQAGLDLDFPVWEAEESIKLIQFYESLSEWNSGRQDIIYKLVSWAEAKKL